MNVWKNAGVAIAAAVLAACANTGASQLPPSNAVRAAGSAARRGFATVRADRDRSWMSPQAKKTSLLYISDVRTGDVYVYGYPGGKALGKLTGFGEPQGECTDTKGDVWIANTAKSQLVEYAHGGTSVIATLKDPGQYPSGCAVDGAGDVAVTNIVSTRGGQGSLAWYTRGAGKPTLISSPSFQEMYFDGFDAAGNLFVDGWPPNFAQAQLGELPHGGTSIVPITVSGATIRYPGGVAVEKKTLAVGDQVNDAVFQLTESGTVMGYTPLDGAYDCVQGTIEGNVYVCPDSVNAAVEYFAYPAGGAPTHVISGLSEPTGSAISK
jgi:hypothetical protein